jgi:hypothetical protein
MKRILMISLAVGSVTLAAACGDENDEPLIQRGELGIAGEGDPVQLPQGTVGVDYSATVTATGGTQRLINWTLLDEDQFPTGLYITTGLNPLNISGRPRVAGDFNFRLQVTDSAGAVATKSFSMSVVEGPPELAITNENTELPVAALNEPYAPFQFEAEGGSGSGYIFSADPDQLPPGMLLDPDGELSGTPTRVGTYPFEVRLRDSVGNTAEQFFNIEVESFIPPFEFPDTTCPDGKADDPYECELRMEGGVMPYELEIGAGGGAPPGLELIQPGPMERIGYLRGVPTQPGNYAFQIRASDSERGVDRQSFFVFIDEADAPLRVTGRILFPDIPNDAGEPTEAFEFSGYEVSKQITAEIVAIGGSEEGYSWETVSGDFPPGCSFTSSTPNAILECTPTRAGCFPFELVVVDSDGERSVPREFTLCVRPEVQPVEITSATGLPGVTVLPQALTSTTADPAPEYQVEITASGGLPAPDLGYGWTVLPRDGLPPGLRIFTNGAPSTFIQGTATATGTYDFNISVYDLENRTTTAPFRIEVVTSTTSTTSG